MAYKNWLLILLLAFALLLSGCTVDRSDPPSTEDAKAFLEHHKDDIDIIVEYLRGLKADLASISNANGTIFYEFENHDIESKNVKMSIRHLWSAGCKSICKNDRRGNNSISIEIWCRTIGDVDCGIACTIDGQGTPKTEFQIECEKIAEDWFYYFDDYEEYRNHPTTES